MADYRSLQQIAAQSLVKSIDSLLDDLTRFGAMTSPAAIADSIEKVRKVQRRIADHMHKDDRNG